MRVIAGSARGTRLAAPTLPGLRPTSDRARETLFNVLAPHLAEARVLDLFAGSGAASCTFVDRHPLAARAVQANLEKCRLAERGRVWKSPWRAALARLEREGARHDLLLVDPPWSSGEAEPCLAAIAAGSAVARDGIVVLECPADRSPEIPAPLAAYRRLQVGGTAFVLCRLLPHDPA